MRRPLPVGSYKETATEVTVLLGSIIRLIIKLPKEPYILSRHLKFLAGEVVEGGLSFLCIEGEFQAVGVESLIFISSVAVVTVLRILAVTEERVPDMSHMGADLVRSARHKMHLQK